MLNNSNHFITNSKIKPMFYCKECQDLNFWPDGYRVAARCDVCSKETMCHEKAEQYLNIPDNVHRIIDSHKLQFSKQDILDLLGRQYKDLYIWTEVNDAKWINDNVINPKSQSHE